MSAQMYNKAYLGTCLTLLAVTLGLLFPAASRAQVAGGTISGTVSDSSGRVIPSAQISITNVDTRVSRTAATNEDGFYTAPNLLPGNYELRFSAPGFKTEVRSRIALTVGAAAVLDLTMQVGTAVETLQVTSEAPTVQLASSDISAVVNAITRSGTNQIHGSAYEFLRNSKLDARNFFDADKIPPFKRNQFGGAIGGPILKDRTFFFADYEGIRQSKGISTLAFVPSQNARNGLLCSNPAGADPSNPCATTQITVDPSAAEYLTFYHLPNGPILGNGDTGEFTFVGQQIVNENFLTARVDHKVSNNDSLFGTYMFDKTPYASPDGLNNVEFTTLTSRQFAALEETHIFSPGFANSIRIGGNHEAVNNNESLKAINPDAARIDLGVGGAAFAGRKAAQVLVGGLSDFTGGVGGSPTYFYHWNSIQLYDDAFFTKGTHSIRFGVAVERMLPI